MNSAFLFLAMVVIWVFVLVPRWLRRQHAAPQPGYEADELTGSADYEEFGYGMQDEASAYDADPASAGSPEDLGYEDAAAYPDEAAYGPEPAQRELADAPPSSRSRVLQARRRFLTMLVLLAAAAVTCTLLKLTAWWICIPPAAMLGMYLLLLREAAVADAELAYWRAAEWQAWADREQMYQARAAQARAAQAQVDEASAEIIDISGRVGDMLYDQYADAAVRAVGD